MTTHPITTDRLLAAVAGGVRIVDLGRPLESGMPCSPNHPGFRMALVRRHGDMNRPDGGSAANEMFTMGGHVGTHIDALSHVSHNGLLHGGHSAARAQTGGRFSVHGIETVTPLIRRGLLLDVAAARSAEILPGGYGITAEDLATAAGDTEPGEGDVVLVHTGWGRHWPDPEAYLGTASGVPGLTEDAARWLAERRIRAVGADTTAVERIPPGQGHRVMPVHRILLVDHGIHIIEHLDLTALAAERPAPFTFVAVPLPIVGGTGSPVRPLALFAEEAP
ncbi:cyclase family protein [Streptantibioticus cattleyicolor]|uniref:Putative cyclase n=1 Tax=Streptantibioticus cattleyicolor (strain ATCC 35852 / DSM 46488 / JCM 4925 / NBRC 14057 / NRRL 8057) TaxID=1003195 RepID=F8JMY4_STREN|nr:cyclase family protein [Streptantibioticus cattleyicolor]AEW98581.1 putative cyclase [Streptantibioticus cattleyicolor NRRL 8057 = DSM 46488]CCB72361.1 conserved protein of unknown function [Streptantibioticus cattleyicolor NRRL 8057 = DSM 46488]